MKTSKWISLEKVLLPSNLLKLQLMVLTGSLYVSTYLNYNLFESISFWTRDGWCDDSIRRGIGIHCFGDFYYNFNFARADHPHTSGYPQAYTPLAILMFGPFIFLNELFPGTPVSLILYLLANIFAVLAALRYFLRGIIPRNFPRTRVQLNKKKGLKEHEG